MSFGLVPKLSQVEWLVTHRSGAESQDFHLGDLTVVEGRDSPVGTWTLPLQLLSSIKQHGLGAQQGRCPRGEEPLAELPPGCRGRGRGDSPEGPY